MNYIIVILILVHLIYTLREKILKNTISGALWKTAIKQQRLLMVSYRFLLMLMIMKAMMVSIIASLIRIILKKFHTRMWKLVRKYPSSQIIKAEPETTPLYHPKMNYFFSSRIS